MRIFRSRVGTDIAKKANWLLAFNARESSMLHLLRWTSKCDYQNGRTPCARPWLTVRSEGTSATSRRELDRFSVPGVKGKEFGDFIVEHTSDSISFFASGDANGKSGKITEGSEGRGEERDGRRS